jgi:hypothetical protein
VPFSSLVLLVLVLPVVVIGLANYPFLALGILLVLSGWVLYSAPSGGHWPFLFCLAAVIGTLGEAYCVYGSWPPHADGLYNYHFPRTFGLELPIWLPLIWGNLFVFFVGLSHRLTPPYEQTLTSYWGRAIKYGLVLVILAYAGFLYDTVKYVIRYAMTPLLAFFFTFWNHVRDVSIFFIAGLGGTIAEIVAMRFGLWSYTYPMFRSGLTDWLGIPGLPVSLSMAWGISCLVLNRFAIVLNRTFRTSVDASD